MFRESERPTMRSGALKSARSTDAEEQVRATMSSEKGTASSRRTFLRHIDWRLRTR